MKDKILTTITVAVCLAAGVAQPLRAQDPSRIERSERRRAAMFGLAPDPAERPVGGQYSPQTLEDLRAELLNLTDAVQEFSVLVPVNPVDLDSLQQTRLQIQQMPPQWFNALRAVIDPARLHARLQRARAVFGKYSMGRPAINRNTNMTQGVLPADSPGFPDPNDDASESCTSFLGTTGADATSVTRYPTDAVLAADAIWQIADTVRELAQDACKETLVALGEGGNTSLACVIVDSVWIIAKFLDFKIHFCDDDVSAAVGDASYLRLGAINDEIGTLQTGVSNINTNTSNVGGQLTTIGNQISSVGAQVSGVDTHLSNVDSHISSEIVALDAHMTALLAVLQASVDLANQRLLKTIAGEAQIMKLDLTPEGSRILLNSILTCTGSNCPNVLANCPGGICSWSSVGPLP